MPLGLISGIGSITTSTLTGLGHSVALATRTVATIAQPAVPVNSFIQPVVVVPAPSSEEEDPGTYGAVPPASSGETMPAAPAAPGTATAAQSGDESMADPPSSVAAGPRAGAAAPVAVEGTGRGGVGTTEGGRRVEDSETGTFDGQAFLRSAAEAKVAGGLNDRLIERIANPATAHALMLMKPVEDDASGPAEAQQAYSANAAAAGEDRKTSVPGEPAVQAA